jgi:hypothetical protein
VLNQAQCRTPTYPLSCIFSHFCGTLRCCNVSPRFLSASEGIFMCRIFQMVSVRGHTLESPMLSSCWCHSLLRVFDLCFIISDCGVSFSDDNSWTMWKVITGLQTHTQYELGLYQRCVCLKGILNALLWSSNVPTWTHPRPHSLVPAWALSPTLVLILGCYNCLQISSNSSTKLLSVAFSCFLIFSTWELSFFLPFSLGIGIYYCYSKYLQKFSRMSSMLIWLTIMPE